MSNWDLTASSILTYIDGDVFFQKLHNMKSINPKFKSLEEKIKIT